MEINRYHRQMLLPFIGRDGQDALEAAGVVVLGCGALGGVIAEQLARAGVGRLTLIDRDIVEWTNLQRQVLFDEADARGGAPKAVAAAERLRRINSTIRIEPIIADVHSGNVESLLLGQPNSRPDLILDGTDNAEIRYLLNDVAIKNALPWVYGACISAEGRAMLIEPGRTACLRCLFPDPPEPGELPTCDTAGVLGSAAAVVASLQVTAALRWLVGSRDRVGELLTFDLWAGRFHRVRSAEPEPDCPACGRRRFDFLNQRHAEGSARLCGRDAVQIQGNAPVDLDRFADRAGLVGRVERNRFFARCRIDDGIVLTLFPDGRAIVQGTGDPARARSIHARYVGA